MQFCPTEYEDLSPCDDCGCYTNHVHRRKTMKGQFCADCAQLEKCGACGEMFSTVQYDEASNMYLCAYCADVKEEELKSSAAA